MSRLKRSLIEALCFSFAFCLLSFLPPLEPKGAADYIFEKALQLNKEVTCSKKQQALELVRAYEVLRLNNPAAGIQSRADVLAGLEDYLKESCGSTPSIVPGVKRYRHGGGSVKVGRAVPVEILAFDLMTSLQKDVFLDNLEENGTKEAFLLQLESFKAEQNMLQNYIAEDRKTLDKAKLIDNMSQLVNQEGFKQEKKEEFIKKYNRLLTDPGMKINVSDVEAR